MDKNTNCDPCEEQGNRTEGKSWCPNCEEKLCNGCASQEAQLPVVKETKPIEHFQVSHRYTTICTKRTWHDSYSNYIKTVTLKDHPIYYIIPGTPASSTTKTGRHNIAESGVKHNKNVCDLLRKYGLEWLDFVPEDQIEKFLKDKKLDFAVAVGNQPSTPTVSMPIEIIQNTLEDLIVEKTARNEDIFDWIEANFDDITTKDKKFIRDLMTAVCSSAITGRGNSARVDPPRIIQRGVILQKYLDHQAELELQALYALQALVHKLEHPPGVLRTLFDTLYDEDLISEDAFNQWETGRDPAEQEGKGVAMKQVVQFFTWLREADDEVDS